MAMVKSNYKIPGSLDQSFLDHEIDLSGGGTNFGMLSLKVILFWVCSILLLFWVVSSTFVASSAWWMIALVIIWWLAATAFFGRTGGTKGTKEMVFMRLPALINYIPAAARTVYTRTSSKPGPFYSIVRMKDLDETGFIEWSDGTVGQAYMVVGSASVLVFEEDKAAMIARVDQFWRKAEPDCEFIQITTKEPQRVYRQLAHQERINQALEVRDPELVGLINERTEVLRGYVGSSFNSIHQYLVVKADNREALQRAHSMLESEVEQSSLMIKQATMLDDEDAYDMFGVIYTSR